MKVSVIVCTHNRCNDLMRTLNSLAAQDYPKSYYEVVVVDNRSTDMTKNGVDEFIRREDVQVNVRYIFEEKI